VDAPRNGAVTEEAGREGYLEEEGGACRADVEDVSGGRVNIVGEQKLVAEISLPAVCDRCWALFCSLNFCS